LEFIIDVVSFIEQSFVDTFINSFKFKFGDCELSLDDVDDSRGDGLPK
jgi:hypothetical protein